MNAEVERNYHEEQIKKTLKGCSGNYKRWRYSNLFGMRHAFLFHPMLWRQHICVFGPKMTYGAQPMEQSVLHPSHTCLGLIS